MMKVLITAGGTNEDIDSVRSITNRSTGRLGSAIADMFASKGAIITYVCGEKAVLPSAENVEIIRIRNVKGLLELVEELLKTRKFDCVIHSMAVSDFTPQAILTLDDIVENVLSAINGQNISQSELEREIRSAVLASGRPLNDSKISSKNSDLMISLGRTPKVIGRIKAIQPETILVGFKLLSGASEEELLQAGERLLLQNSCDFVLANDLRDVENESHKAFLINKSGLLYKADTKQEIAEVIYKAVSEIISREDK